MVLGSEDQVKRDVSELPRRRAHSQGNAPPWSYPSVVGWEMQDNPSHRNLNPDTKLQKSLAQSADLRRFEIRSRCQPTHFLHENVGGGSHEHTELIRPEA